MAPSRRAKSSRDKVGNERARLRRQGLRPIEVWVPDTRAPGFRNECRTQSRRATRARHAEREIMDWIDVHRDNDPWTE